MEDQRVRPGRGGAGPAAGVDKRRGPGDAAAPSPPPRPSCSADEAPPPPQPRPDLAPILDSAPLPSPQPHIILAWVQAHPLHVPHALPVPRTQA